MSGITEAQMAKIKEIICDILEVDENEMTEVSLFQDDHDADSLRAIEILAALEKEFVITIDQADLSRMVHLKGVYEVVAESAGW